MSIAHVSASDRSVAIFLCALTNIDTRTSVSIRALGGASPTFRGRPVSSMAT